MKTKVRNTALFLAAMMILSMLFTGCNINKPGGDANSEGTGPSAGADATSTPVPTPTPKPEVKAIKAKAVYLTGWSAGNDAKIQQIVNLAKTTELNAVVIDIKDDDGFVGYETGISEVRELGGWKKKYDVDKAIKTLHDNGVYVIGRLVCFKDPILAQKKPELAYKSKNGGVWKDRDGKPWVNPMNKESWEYVLKIAYEAIDKGFDEIQYDYVRFCNDGDTKLIDYGPEFDPETKSDVIAEFLKKSYEEIHENRRVVLTADVFGIAAVSKADDKSIGQNWEKLAKEVDYMCPMVYPSHYANSKQNGVGQGINGVTFTKPDLDPYNVVYQTLLAGKKRLEASEHKAKIRPYLQAFTADYLGAGYYQKYGAEQIKQQIKAVYDAGYEEWILWDARNNYPQEYFEAKQ